MYKEKGYGKNLCLFLIHCFDEKLSLFGKHSFVLFMEIQVGQALHYMILSLLTSRMGTSLDLTSPDVK